MSSYILKKKDNGDSVYVESPCWNWFELSYAAYLVLPRVLMCGMPLEWQEKFVALLEEMQDTYDLPDGHRNYSVLCKDDKGKFKHDSFRNYRHYSDPLPYKQQQEGV